MLRYVPSDDEATLCDIWQTRMTHGCPKRRWNWIRIESAERLQHLPIALRSS